MSLRTATKLHSASPGKGYSPTKVSTKGSSVGFSNGSMKNSGVKGMRTTGELSKHLKNLQHQADENIEDEYIKNLQQQIAYQELELKLLKEKELDQKQSVSQIDKFFNDGVPLNENILALKNQYNHIKKTMENKIHDLNDNRVVEMKIAADLKAKYLSYQTNLKTINEALDKKDKDFFANIGDLRMAYLNEKHTREEQEKELKKLQTTLKEKNTENLQMTRDQEREAILVHHKEEVLKNKRLKTVEDLKNKAKLIVGLQNEVEKINSEATFNPEVSILFNENQDLSQRVVRFKKEISMAAAKVSEMELYLETRSKERELEAELKRNLISRINQLKFRIEEQHKVNEIEIKKKVEEKEAKQKKDLENEINEVKGVKTITKQRQQQKEDHISEMAQEKMGLQQDIMSLEQDNTGLEKDIK